MGFKFNMAATSTVKKSEKYIGDIRCSQVITTYGPGSMANLKNGSVMIASPEYWEQDGKLKDSHRIYEENLQRLLGVDYFYPPPVDTKEGYFSGKQMSLRARRFPYRYTCPKCNKLHHIKGFVAGDKLECKRDRSELLPSRFMCACINGHIEDFPYHWWVHEKSNVSPEAYKDHTLYLETDKSKNGLESIIVRCQDCDISRSMEGCMSENALRDRRCHGKSPWLPNNVEEASCDATLRTVQRNASNVYFSATVSALTLPRGKNKPSMIRDVLSKKDISDHVRDVMELPTEFRNKMLPNSIKTWFVGFGTLPTVQEVIEAYESLEQSVNKQEEEFTIQDIMEDEYNVMCQGSVVDTDPIRYQAEEVPVPSSLKPVAARITRIKRLREVMAIQGFRRLVPEYPEDLDSAKGDVRFQGWNGKQYVPLTSRTMSWLPAVELLGEGIFVQFDEEAIDSWERQNAERYRKLAAKAQIGVSNKDASQPRYVFLHTFAHLLMRQLTLECGYSGAALKERIYSTFKESRKKMCGVLIYTATPDSDGSLGGLVRMALPENLDRIIRDMVHEASWCSTNPVCITSEGQGRNGANYAACHACTLLPETSCENGNVYLDRASIVGLLDDKSVGLLSYLFNEK